MRKPGKKVLATSTAQQKNKLTSNRQPESNKFFQKKTFKFLKNMITNEYILEVESSTALKSYQALSPLYDMYQKNYDNHNQKLVDRFDDII